MGHIKPDLIDVDLIRGELENWFFYTYYIFSFFLFHLPTWQTRVTWEGTSIEELPLYQIDLWTCLWGIFWLIIDVGVPAHLRDATPG